MFFRSIFFRCVFEKIIYQIFFKKHYKWFFNIISDFLDLKKCFLNFTEHLIFFKKNFKLKMLYKIIIQPLF